MTGPRWWELPECEHGAPGGSPATCALCRVADPTYVPPPKTPPRPKRGRRQPARAGARRADGYDARQLQLPLGDRE